MSIIYDVDEFDTFEIISRKVYGTEFEANRIARANPGVSEPLTIGTKLTIPDSPDAPQDLQQQSISDNPNETAILIDNKRFKFWNTINITRSIDTFDTIGFEAPFDYLEPAFRSIFQPFSYKKIVVTVGGEPLFTGTMIVVSPNLRSDEKTISINGYSLPGVLNDCTAPASALDTLEFDGQGLRDIATTLASLFGLSVDFQADQGAVFERVALDSKQKVFTFLVELAKQRNLIISSTSKGKLLFQQSVVTGNPVAILEQGVSPLLSVTPLFNPQEYYSHVTGLEPTLVGVDGGQFTVKNPHLQGVIRPFTFNLPDTLVADAKAAVDAKIGRMIGNMVVYSVSVDTWRDRFGNLWTPNTKIKLLAPDAMIYNSYEFIIKSVNFERNQKSESAVLNLVLSGSFSGEIPGVLPWE